MSTRLRNESGIGLVELLIAMTVMSVAIFALVAGLTSGVESTKRASKASTAGTLADKRMESYRRGTYDTIPSKDAPGPAEDGPDGRKYFVSSSSVETCIFGGTPYTDNTLTPPAPRCAAVAGPPAQPKSRPVRVVTVIVRDGTLGTDPVLITQTSTFDQSTGS